MTSPALSFTPIFNIHIQDTQHKSQDYLVEVDVDEPFLYLEPDKSPLTIPTTRYTKYHIYAGSEIPDSLRQSTQDLLIQQEKIFIEKSGHLSQDPKKELADLKLEENLKNLLTEQNCGDIYIFEVVRGFSYEMSEVPSPGPTFTLAINIRNDSTEGMNTFYDCYQFKITTLDGIRKSDIDMRLLSSALCTFCNRKHLFDYHGNITDFVRQMIATDSYILNITKPANFLQVYSDEEDHKFGRVIYPKRPKNLIHDYVFDEETWIFLGENSFRSNF